MQSHCRCSHDRKDRALKEGRRKSDNISWQYCIYDLSAAFVQQRVAEAEPALDEVQCLVFITLDDDVLPLLHSDLAIEHATQGFQILGINHPVSQELNNERVPLDWLAFGDSCTGGE